jgi:hypothetical protein
MHRVRQCNCHLCDAKNPFISVDSFGTVLKFVALDSLV